MRAQFPALQPDRAGSFIFFDNAAGAQIPQSVLDAVTHHLLDHNVQRGGRYGKSRLVDQAIADARESVAVLINAADPAEICFGMNATSFIRMVSLAIGQTLGPSRNEIVVTDMDHDANIATWLQLEKAGAKFQWWRMRDDGTLHADDLKPLLSNRTRIVACTKTAHSIGSIVDVAAAAKLAHAAGAEVFIDCVHLRAARADRRAGLGLRLPRLLRLQDFRAAHGLPLGEIRRAEAAPDLPRGLHPRRAALQDRGRHLRLRERRRHERRGPISRRPRADGRARHEQFARRQDIAAAMHAIRGYEQVLAGEMIKVLKANGAVIYGISDEDRLDGRVPTICFNIPGHTPQAIADAMDAAGIGIRDGHMYAPRLMKRLNLPMETGCHPGLARPLQHARRNRPLRCGA